MGAAATAGAAVERDAERAKAYVAGVWERTGAGPTWTELGDALGWAPGVAGADHPDARA